MRSAVALTEAVNYRSAGTVEFVVDADTGEYAFLEVNTRLQVEHPVTEMVTGIDLVEWMVRLARGDLPPLAELAAAMQPAGAAIEARVYAGGSRARVSAQRRDRDRMACAFRCAVLDTWVGLGTEVTSFYDPLLAKIVVHGADRNEAIDRLTPGSGRDPYRWHRDEPRVARAAARDIRFRGGRGRDCAPRRCRDHRGRHRGDRRGRTTTVQDYPGRLGYWDIGVPPSGDGRPRVPLREPTRRQSERRGRHRVHDDRSRARFTMDAVVALTGARMDADVDGTDAPWWTAFTACGRYVLRMGAVGGAGARTYLAVRGGLEVPDYLGSRSTFILGRFGGHAGRARPATCCMSAPRSTPTPRSANGSRRTPSPSTAPHGTCACSRARTRRPTSSLPPTSRCCTPPNGEVHHHSDRTGVRLIGPAPEWARPDGGEAGLHPSNIHDNEYAIGTIDFTGDMPIVLGPDGPSLGGFVCPATVATADRWKLGQLHAGDRVRLRAITHADALEHIQRNERILATLGAAAPDPGPTRPLSRTPDEAVLHFDPADATRPALTIRRAGDAHILVEFGPNVLDLARACTRCIKHWDPAVSKVWPSSHPVFAPCSCVSIPRSSRWTHSSRRSSTRRHEFPTSTRSRSRPASCTSRSRGTTARPSSRSSATPAARRRALVPEQSRVHPAYQRSRLDRRRVPHRVRCELSRARAGDVYLGAPVATPVDPRHRLVTTKYNPARTWTPENAVGIGGAYLCVYGMEGPGGYQFVGRTVQVWNRWHTPAEFEPGHPWLLRFFDQLRFHPVSEEELLEQRDAIAARCGGSRHRADGVPHGGPSRVSRRAPAGDRCVPCGPRRRLCRRTRPVEAPRGGGVRQRHARAGPGGAEPPLVPGDNVAAPVQGTVWKMLVAAGDTVAAGDVVAVVEAMKTEVSVSTISGGRVQAVRCTEGALGARVGQTLVVLA